MILNLRSCVAKSFWVNSILVAHFEFEICFNYILLCLNEFMSTQFNLDNNQSEFNNSQSKVKVTDLLSRLNEEKRIEKQRNLALGVAAVSAVTVFGIILTI